MMSCYGALPPADLPPFEGRLHSHDTLSTEEAREIVTNQNTQFCDTSTLFSKLHQTEIVSS